MRVKVVKSLGRLGTARELPDELARLLVLHCYAVPEIAPAALGVVAPPVAADAPEAGMTAEGRAEQEG